MNRGYATCFALSFVSGGIVLGTWLIVHRLVPDENRKLSVRWLTIWSIKALVMPLAIWAFINIGLSWSLQPFLPQIQFAKNSGKPWGSVFFEHVGYGFFIISSYWAAMTLTWAIQKAAAGLEEQHRSDFKALCLTCVLGLCLPALGIGFIGGLPILGFATAVIVGPIAGYAPNVLRAKKAAPLYARAVARIKFGKYKEAEWEIIRELEKAEDDFEGWMMLAELYAKNFGDLPEAEQTIIEVCDHPRTTPSQLSVALHRLSEWHLNLGNNPYAARRVLQIICDRLPGTHLGHMAQLRINQLPKSDEEMREFRNPRPIRIPNFDRKPGKD